MRATDRRHVIYLEKSPNWASGSLKEVLETYAPGISGKHGELDKVKTNYFNPQNNIEIKFDNQFNYFRIYDRTRKQYLNINGGVVNTNEGGRTGDASKNYLQQQTHIRNTDPSN